LSTKKWGKKEAGRLAFLGLPEHGIKRGPA
jgi:hypothetical protein